MFDIEKLIDQIQEDVFTEYRFQPKMRTVIRNLMQMDYAIDIKYDEVIAKREDAEFRFYILQRGKIVDPVIAYAFFPNDIDEKVLKKIPIDSFL